MSHRPLAMTAAEVSAYLDEVFPEVKGDFEILRLDPMEAEVRLITGPKNLRPGGTISGPSMFALADVSFYIATLGMIGRQALTVTTNVSIDFMRKPAPRDLRCVARIMKLGRTLSVGDATLWSEGVEGPVAHANLTYSIPPARG